jgi:hypothetical protein
VVLRCEERRWHGLARFQRRTRRLCHVIDPIARQVARARAVAEVERMIRCTSALGIPQKSALLFGLIGIDNDSLSPTWRAAQLPPFPGAAP